MDLHVRAVLDAFRDAVGRIMIIVGFLLLIYAIASFSMAYQWESSASLILGVFLILVGLFLHFETFRFKIPSKEGWGAILICVSAVLMASAVAATFFTVAGREHLLRLGRREVIWVTLLEFQRPVSWLAPIFGFAGVGLFVVGFFLKFSRDML